MVSYPDSQGAERTLAHRRAPSVASSRTSTIRRHRPHRSHFGGATYQPQNEFPVFSHTGDVEIIIGDGRKEQRYTLHKLILTQCSGFFEASLSEEWEAAREGNPRGHPHAHPAPSTGSSLSRIPSGGQPEQKKKWRYELDWGQKDDEIPMLIQRKPPPTLFGGDQPQPLPPRNKPPAPGSGFFRSMANFSTLHIPPSPQEEPEDEIFRDYDNLFRIFYNYPPTLDAVNIPNAYVQCKSLLQLADMYDALEVIGPRVDHHLLRFQGRLWKQIAKYPPSYLKLGYLARSKAIFGEALIHVVGQWPAGAQQLRGQIPDPVIEIIEDKVDDLEELTSKIEGKLFRLTLTTSRGERVTPSNNWLDWLAMSLFRQWLAENTTPPPAPILKSPHNQHPSQSQLPPKPPIFNTGRIYRLLGTGGSSYLGHDECKRFLRLSSEHYNRENLRRFERRMDEVKNLAREVVRPLMRNFLELDLTRDGGNGGGGLPYLTCTRVEGGDYVWEE